MRAVPAFILLAALLSGCTVLRIDQRPLRNPAEEPAGEIRFLANHGGTPRRLSEGYHLTVMKDFSIVDRLESSTTGPAAAEGLKPGTYDISVAGRGIGTESTRVQVRPGKAVTVRLDIVNARRLHRCGETALTAGKVALYVVGAIAAAPVFIAVAILCADDDDDDDDESVSSLSRPKTDRSPHPGSVGKYRRKD